MFASFKGTRARCDTKSFSRPVVSGGHAIWWTVDAGSEVDALALLPFYVAERTNASGVTEVKIP